MNKLTKRLVTAAATGALLFNTMLPVFADTTIEISGNGTDSNNIVTVDQENTVGVEQTNQASIQNNIDADARTGGNDAEDNTNGDVEIKTGDATVGVAVNNSANSNEAEVGCCDGGDVDVLVSENGSNSDNIVTLGDGEGVDVGITQNNQLQINNNVDADAKTGKNDANDNTGGDVEIDTGDATVGVTISNSGNANSASVGGDGHDGRSLSARILGNGADSLNVVTLDFDDGVLVTQGNMASVHNNVDADAKTGKNDANDNTGGEVKIKTGNATALVGIDNMLNFNWADLDCGCLLGDYLLKIAGNGSNTDNILTLDLDGITFATQRNVLASGLRNNVDADAKTGKNDVKDSTGSTDGDPVIDTGDALVDILVGNSGNYNGVNGDDGFHMPDFGDFEFHFGFNWVAIWAWMLL